MSTPQRYEVIEKLDSGGMAEVWKGKVRSVQGISKLVAIKRILPSLTKNEKFVEMFLDEARLSMRLNHANIVQVFDLGVADGTYFIVMEFVDGVNLRKLLEILSEKGIRLPFNLALYLIMEVCKGLAHAHERKDQGGAAMQIVHRDISPPNILISRAGEVKITDFGLAKAKTQISGTDPGVVKGKFSYLSPEAANGIVVDFRTDIFAVGIVLYEILANRRLFLGKTDYQTVELIRKAQIPSLRKYNPQVDEEFEKVVLRALARDPDQRTPSMRVLGDALADYLFENRLKVTQYELQEFMVTVLSEEEEEEQPQHESALLSGIIQQEIMKFTSLDLGDVELFDDGAKPLTEKDLSSAVPSDFNYQYHLAESAVQQEDEEEDDEHTIIDVPYHFRNDMLDNVDSLENLLEGSESSPSIKVEVGVEAFTPPDLRSRPQKQPFNPIWLAVIIPVIGVGLFLAVYFLFLR